MAVISDTGASDAKVIGVLGAGHFFSHFYLLCLPPLFPALRGEFGVSFAALGLMMTSYNLIGGLIQAPMGFLIDRFGARWILIAGVVLMSGAVLLMGFTESYEAILVLAVLAGLGNSVIHPADYAVMSGAISEGRLGRAFSLHTFSGEFGGAFAPVVMGTLAAMWDWRSALMAAGAAGLVVAAIMASQSRLLVDDTGGTRADAGVDSNRSGVLDAGEITATSYLCRTSAGWVTIDTASAQASSNTGYLANSSSEVALTLPANPSVGDTVNVSGAGAGGWKLVQNAGQSIHTNNLPGSSSTGTFAATSAPQQNWWSLASSANGQKLIAGLNGATNGFGTRTYVSTDYGQTWSDLSPSAVFAEAYVTISPDGGHLLNALPDGHLWLSTNDGSSWANVTPSPTSSWRATATSADGSVVLAADNSGAVYMSTDTGSTWSLSTTMPQGARGAAVSSDGTVLAVTSTGGNIWVSTDGGTNWNARASAQPWTAIAMSSNGSHLAATIGGGQIYTSTDSGATWTLQATSPALSWTGIASSSSGNRLLAVNGSQIFESTDSGATWASVTAASQNPRSVAMSADGTRSYTSTYNGLIWSAAAHQTTVGTAGSMAGAHGDAVALQYLGDGVFIVLNYTSNSGAFTIK